MQEPAVAYNVLELMETGILIESGDIKELTRAIMYLLMDNNFRNGLTENAHGYAQGFSWGKTVENFLTVIEDAVYE